MITSWRKPIELLDTVRQRKVDEYQQDLAAPYEMQDSSRRAELVDFLLRLKGKKGQPELTGNPDADQAALTKYALS